MSCIGVQGVRLVNIEHGIDLNTFGRSECATGESTERALE